MLLSALLTSSDLAAGEQNSPAACVAAGEALAESILRPRAALDLRAAMTAEHFVVLGFSLSPCVTEVS